MGREILLKGDIINGEFQYEIESVSGTGATCIVYKAWYKENDNSEPHCVQLKELYPYDVGLFRDASNNLICKTDDDKKKFDEYKKNFEASNNMLVKLNSLTDSTPREIKSFSYNGTIYSIVAYNNGKQYSEEKLQAIDLGSLLQIVKSLTISVSRLHEEGYLHLDIKPDNFLINDIDGAILFDVDSVVPVDEIKYRNGISYSKKWAAPEVKYAAEKSDYKDISCKSDIFSIGVILFEAIMGRDFLPMETVSYNRNWDIENSIKNREEKQNRKVNINPKFYHKIKEIFEKTLDRNLSKRYNSAQELYDNLDKARDLLKEKPWIIPSDRTVTPQFTGRKSELSNMTSILQKENTVFLHGFGGMGKSELALKYAEVYKKDFDTVVFCKYENNIKETLLNIRIANYTNDSNTMTLRKIAELCDERTLVILDNFDVETDVDDYLDDFINNYNCKKIITTRTDFSELYTQLDVEALRQDDAILLFEKESKWIPKTEDEEKTLNEILKLIGYHTYFTVILAKKKEMFSLSIDELKKQTEEMLLKKSGKITVAKDGKLTTATVDAIAAKLFDFNSIIENQKQTLRNLYMLRWRTVSRNDYAEIAGFGMSEDEKIELMDSLNDLTRLGWVLYNEKTDDFFLHPIMIELIKDDCKKSNYFAENVVKYYKSKLEYNKNRRASAEEIAYVLSYVIKEIIFLCDLLFTISEENACIVIDFIEETLRLQYYARNFEAIDLLRNDSLFHKMVNKINKHCLTKASLETHLKWVNLLVNGGYRNHVIKYEECDYPKHCVILHNKLGVSKESATEIKKQYWYIVREYMLNMKDELYDKGKADESLTESDLKLISYVEEIQDIFYDGEEDLFNMFKEWESYKADSKSYEDNYIEFENDNYQKYLQKINTLQYVTKEIYTDIMKDEFLDSDEQYDLLDVLIVNAIKQTNYKTVYNNIAASDEFTEDAKKDLLHVVFVETFDALRKDLDEQIEDKMDEYGDVLISYAERELEWLSRYKTASKYRKGMFLSDILLVHYVKDREKFITNLDALYENLCIKYSIKNKDQLTPEWWSGICDAFRYVYKSHEIYPFVNSSINRILDEMAEIQRFPFFKLLKDLAEEVYIVTNNEKYRELSNNYKTKMKELSDINYEIKD